MKRHVRVYVEGGGEGKTSDSDFRRGWKRFLAELHELARGYGYHSLEVVRGKGRGRTFNLFSKHKSSRPQDLCVLLADSETSVPMADNLWNVVATRPGDKWQRPTWAEERHLYLMVHFVETWLLTDQEALQRFFKKGFNAKPLPTTNLESRSKADIEQALKKATQDTSKGSYRHGQAHEIIELVSPEKVKTLMHGARLFDTLSEFIKGSP